LEWCAAHCGARGTLVESCAERKIIFLTMYLVKGIVVIVKICYNISNDFAR
jgi:hypothetical protein